MSKEILLYGSIYNYSAELFIENIQAAEGEDIVVRINTTGGDVLAGYGMIAKFAEFKGSKKIKVDGQAASMGAFFLAYADEVEALDVSQIMIHRAAYPSWYEARDSFAESEEYNFLVQVNKDLRKALEAKIDSELFEKTAGVSLDEVFSMDSRIDVNLTSKEAKKIGLISKVKVLNSNMVAEINSNRVAAAARFGLESLSDIPEAVLNNKSNNNKNKIKMTVDQLKSEHPDVYSQVFEAGSKSGVKAERDNSSAWLAFIDADKEAVVNAVKSGKEFTTADMADMNVKLVSALKKNELEEGSADDVTPEAVNHSGEVATSMSDFNSKLDEFLKKISNEYSRSKGSD